MTALDRTDVVMLDACRLAIHRHEARLIRAPVLARMGAMVFCVLQ
ncbi:hypothetical protein [Methylocystis sp. SC2]|nr:hypothetical protein [Methylocystis sp. SC2]